MPTAASENKATLSAAGRDNSKLFWDVTAELIKSTNEDVARTKAELAFFLASTSFIFLTIWGIEDSALLVRTRISLPIFGASVNLNSFLGGSPLLVICIHAVILLKFRKLQDKCGAITTRMINARRLDFALAKALQLRVSSNFLTQWIMGRSERFVIRSLNLIVYVSCLYLFPVVTLIFLMLRTLPLHDNYLTTLQSTFLCFDIWISLCVARSGRLLLATAVTVPTTIFFGLLLCVPDSWQDEAGRYLISASVPYGSQSTRRAFWLTAYLLESEVDPVKGRPVWLFSRNLVVFGANLGEKEISSGEGTQAATEQDYKMHLALGGRNLRYATLDLSNLRGANLVSADLTGASLQETNLTDAHFGCAARYLPDSDDQLFADAKANCTKFEGANLHSASLDRVSNRTTFDHNGQHTTSFADADLSYATLMNADIPFVNFNRADLSHAYLGGADLANGSLIGANLRNANLEGANLTYVDATLAVFGNASLAGADLSKSRLDAAIFENVDLMGADFSYATLWGARLRNLRIWAARPPGKGDIPLIEVANVNLTPPSAARRKELVQLASQVTPQVQFARSTTLPELMAEIKAPSPRTVHNGKIWQNWANNLDASSSNRDYKSSLSELITAIGCRREQNALGVAKWSSIRPPPQISQSEAADLLGHPPPTEDGPPPVDHRLDKLIGPITETGAVYSSDDWSVISPLPQWYDLNRFLKALQYRDTCKVGKEAGQIISIIKANLSTQTVNTELH